jgi:hypothetical protein
MEDMMISLSNLLNVRHQSIPKAIIADIVIIFVFYLTIMFAHIFPFPIYMIDPMKIFILLSLIFAGRNASLVAAIVLPLVSYVSTGHPIFPKYILISIELVVFVIILYNLKFSNSWGLQKLLMAITLSKFTYYFLKYMVIEMNIIQPPLFSTSLRVQLEASILLVIVYLMMGFLMRQRSK